MAWARVTARTPVFKRGGGALEAGLEASGRGAAAAVRALVFKATQDVVDATVKKAGPGTNRNGWPIGPDRPWDRTWRGHSYRLFRVHDETRGWFVKITVENPADYAMFIHEPGRPSRIVWEREILEPLEARIRSLRGQIKRTIAKAYKGGGNG